MTPRVIGIIPLALSIGACAGEPLRVAQPSDGAVAPSDRLVGFADAMPRRADMTPLPGAGADATPVSAVDTTPSASARFEPVEPFRPLDTRQSARPGPGSSACVKVAGRDGIPASATAVAINLVAVAPTAAGFLVAHPQGVAAPETSTLNHAAGQTIANGTIVEVGTGGNICVQTIAATHIIIDVVGYFGSKAAFAPLAFRRLDTRLGSVVASGSTKCVKLAGRDGVPADAKAVALNLVAVSATGPGHLVAYPDGANKPPTSSLNYAGGGAIANGAIVEVGTGGNICVYALVATHLIIDVVGYFGAGAALAPLAPYRRRDTRGGPRPAAGSTECLTIAGQDGVPAAATAVALSVTAIQPDADGYLVAYPDGQPLPKTSTLNYQPAVVRANNALVAPGDGGKVCIYVLQATHYVLDVVGYWP